MTEAGDGKLQRVRGEDGQFAAAADGEVRQENASSELGVKEVGNLPLQVEEERGREIPGEGEGDARVGNLQQQEAEERRRWRRRSTFTERSTRRRRRREVWLSLIQSWEEKERGRQGDRREFTRSTVVQSRVKNRGEKQSRSRRDDEGLSKRTGRSTGVPTVINTTGGRLTGKTERKEREEQRRVIIDDSLERGMTAMGVRDVVLSSPASAFAGSSATTPTVAAWHFPGAVPSSARSSVSVAGWHLPTAAASPAVGWHLPAAVESPAPTSTSAGGWHFPASSVATPPPTSMASAGWHFPCGVASSSSNSVSAPGFSRHRRYSAPPIAPEFVGCGYSKHPRAAAFRSTSQLPTCSPTCTDCPTSTRLLLMLHSMRLGVDPDVWTRVPVTEPLPMERSRWSRSCMPKKRRRPPRPSAVSSEVVARRSSASEPMIPPFNVLITGSTKGIGYALAKEFLRHGDNVIICSRSEERVQKALKELTKEFGEHRAWGTTCDVRDGKSVRALAEFGKSQLGYIDIWINNAGTNAYSYKALVDTQDDAIAEIVSTNTLGVMLCCRQGIKTMMEQPRGGHIFNMDGAGADGNPTPRFAAYGATKRSLAQFTKSLQAELKQQGIKDVIVHNLSPGMVTTDLLMSGSDTRQAKFFINVLAEPAEEVAQYLVPRIRAIPGDKNRSSKYIRFLTGFKAYTQILARLIFKARKDRFVTED